MPKEGKAVIKSSGEYWLKERGARYKALLGAEKDDIGIENTYLWDVKTV